MKNKLKVGEIIAVDSKELKRVSLAGDFDFIISDFKDRESDSCTLLLKYLGDGKAIEYFTNSIIQVFEYYEDEPTIYARISRLDFKNKEEKYKEIWNELHKLNLEYPIGFYPNAIIENVAYYVAFNGLDKDKTTIILTSLISKAKKDYISNYKEIVEKQDRNELAKKMIDDFKKRELKK